MSTKMFMHIKNPLIFLMTKVREITGTEWKRGSPDKIGTSQDIKNKIKSMPTPKTRALAATLYLTGSRITEIVGGESKYKDKKTGETKKRRVKGFRPEMLVKNIVDGVDVWRFEALEVLKKRKRIDTRTAVVVPWLNDLVQVILDYIKESGIPANERVFKMTRQGAWKMIVEANKNDPLWCHYFRHAHVTQLLKEGKMNHVMVGKEMRWDNISHLSTYAKYDVSDIENHVVAVHKQIEATR